MSYRSFFAMIITALLMTLAIILEVQSSAPSIQNENVPIFRDAHISPKFRSQNLIERTRQNRKIQLVCADVGDSCTYDSDCCSQRCIDMSSLGKGCGFPLPR